MKAAILNSSQDISRHPLRIDEVPQPSVNPGEVLLKVHACGVCRTDLHIVEGELPKLREKLIPGHQIVGEIVEGATPGLPLGTRVGVSWIGGTDGKCWYCQHDFENLCDAATFTGEDRRHEHRGEHHAAAMTAHELAGAIPARRRIRRVCSRPRRLCFSPARYAGRFARRTSLVCRHHRFS